MSDDVILDARKVIQQAEELYCTTSPNDIGDTSPPRSTMELQRHCNPLIATTKATLTSDEIPEMNNLWSCINEHRRHLEKMLPSSRLMKLPAELREQIFAHAVTEWVHSQDEISEIGVPPRPARILQQRAIRMDRLNKPAPPAITLVSRQARAETLQLYYELNVFECWRPFNCWYADWGCSTFIDWLGSLGLKTTWLRRIVLMYKRESELDDYDMETTLAESGFDVRAQIIHRRELSEYEMSYEAMGLPRHFGRPRGRRH